MKKRLAVVFVIFAIASCDVDLDDPVNHPPTVAANIETICLVVGEPIMAIDLGRYFTDPDNDLLTYSAEISNLRAAKVGVGISILRVEAMERGTGYIVVTATDSGGLSATQDVWIEVQSLTGITMGGDTFFPETQESPSWYFEFNQAVGGPEVSANLEVRSWRPDFSMRSNLSGTFLYPDLVLRGELPNERREFTSGEFHAKFHSVVPGWSASGRLIYHGGNTYSLDIGVGGGYSGSCHERFG